MSEIPIISFGFSWTQNCFFVKFHLKVHRKVHLKYENNFPDSLDLCTVYLLFHSTHFHFISMPCALLPNCYLYINGSFHRREFSTILFSPGKCIFFQSQRQINKLIAAVIFPYSLLLQLIVKQSRQKDKTQLGLISGDK